jgi:hypothetical protein
MTKIITDNSKVNINLLEENDFLKNEIQKANLVNIGLTKQLRITVVTFCLPIEGDTFEKWFDKHFIMLGNTMVECKNQATIKYNQEEILELYSFLTDRWTANRR